MVGRRTPDGCCAWGGENGLWGAGRLRLLRVKEWVKLFFFMGGCCPDLEAMIK